MATDGAVARMEGDDDNDEVLVNALRAVSIAPAVGDGSTSGGKETENPILVLDAGYGFPREKKVRKEKINAIACQIANFLVWQIGAADAGDCAAVKVVGCPDEDTRVLLENRTIDRMKRAGAAEAVSSGLPKHATLACESLEECLQDTARHDASPAGTAGADAEPPVYLSPDADQALDPSADPPRIAVVGLLIDRRVQPNRSRDRANKLGVVARRWPLEECFAEIDPREPLNVDCVLEGMQQWWWNSKDAGGSGAGRAPFVEAVAQAIEHHAERHPSRPLHIVKEPV